jgi:acyl carrier protein
MAVLDDYPKVTASIAIPNMERQKFLVFVTVNGPQSKETVQVLLEYCIDRLVDYMFPNRLMILKSFPLDGNGKNDRRMLIRQNRTPQYSGGSLLQAESTTEQRLTEIFAQTLGIPSNKISVHDNFFDLGDHSLLAATAVSSIRESFDTAEFGVRDSFSAIKEIATFLDGHLTPKQKEKTKSTSSFML